MYPTSIRCINSCRAEWEKSNSLWVTCLGTDCPRVSIYCQLLLPCLNQVATALFESSRLCHLIQRALPCLNPVVIAIFEFSEHWQSSGHCHVQIKSAQLQCLDYYWVVTLSVYTLRQCRRVGFALWAWLHGWRKQGGHAETIVFPSSCLQPGVSCLTFTLLVIRWHTACPWWPPAPPGMGGCWSSVPHAVDEDGFITADVSKPPLSGDPK